MQVRAARLALLMTSAFATLSASAAMAQDVDAAAPDEVVVTAQRRSENIKDVPVSVAVVGGDRLRAFQTGGEDILALAGRVPGLYAETTTGRIFPRFYIRGLGNIDFYLGASQPVSIIQDDIVLEHVVLKSNPVFDVAQVEVLRGPQGSLFGRNTTAGIIKFDTIRPSNDLDARAQVSYGSYNTITFDGGIGAPIVDGKAAFRVSALMQHRDNWIDNRFAGASADGTQTPKKDALGGFDERDVRLQFLLTPSEPLSILVSGHGRWYDGTSTVFHRAALTRGSNNVDAEPRKSIALDEARGNPQSYDTYGASVRAAYEFGGATLTSITGYETTSGFSRGDTDGGAAALFPVNGVPNGFGQSQGQVRDLDQWTQELRLASDGTGPFRWQVGGIYFDSRDTTDFYQRGFFLITAARNPNNWVRLRNVNTSWGIFGQVSYDVTPDFTLTAGARESKDTKKTRLLKTANTVANVSTYTGRRFVRLSDTRPSWDVSALYRASPEVSLYARVARGFRGPTIQGRSAVFNADFTTADSETNTSVEAGLKSALLDNRLRFNLTGFAYRVKNIQLNGNDSNGNGVLFNADKADAYGLEAELEARPVNNLSLSAGLSLLHSKIRDKRVFAQVCALNGVVVCTVNDPTVRIGNNVFAQIDGNPLPNAPKYNIDLAARYDVPLARGAGLFAQADYNMQGYTNLVLYRSAEFYAKNSFELGGKLGYTTKDGKYELAVFARNVTNEKNLKGVIENYMAAVFNEPRVIGISLAARTR